LVDKQTGFPEAQRRAMGAGYDYYPLHDIVSQHIAARTFKRDAVRYETCLDSSVVMCCGGSAITLPHQAMADMIARWLSMGTTQNAQRDDLMRLHMPLDAGACRQLVDVFDALTRQIDSDQHAVQNLQHRLDDLVAGYYGLDSDDLAVISAFIETF